MNIVVAVRCLNEIDNIERFVRGYDFADTIVVSDGGSTDGSVEFLCQWPKVQVFHYDQFLEREGVRFNPDNPHINFVLNKAKEFDPDWLIFDDIDDVPNYLLREQAKDILEKCQQPQVNAFRLYLWNETMYFPQMSGKFADVFKSLWAWKPKEIDIHADESTWHGTIVGTTPNNLGLDIPLCLLHKSWDERTIEQKIKRYKLFDIAFGHPMSFAGEAIPLPDYAHE